MVQRTHLHKADWKRHAISPGNCWFRSSVFFQLFSIRFMLHMAFSTIQIPMKRSKKTNKSSSGSGSSLSSSSWSTSLSTFVKIVQRSRDHLMIQKNKLKQLVNTFSPDSSSTFWAGYRWTWWFSCFLNHQTPRRHPHLTIRTCFSCLKSSEFDLSHSREARWSGWS